MNSIYILFTVDKVNYCGLNQKKQKEEKNAEEKREMQTPLSLQSKRSQYEQPTKKSETTIFYFFRSVMYFIPNKIFFQC